MTRPFSTVAALPTARSDDHPFDPPDELAALRDRAPLTRMTFPDGHLGWLATGHAEVRAILADPHFSARPEIGRSALFDLGPLPPAPPGDFLAMDPPRHTRYREVLAGRFTTRRMRRLTEQVAEVSADRLDAMARHGGPMDLVTAFAHPVPALTICALLGIPETDRARVSTLMADMVAGFHDPESAPRARIARAHRLRADPGIPR